MWHANAGVISSSAFLGEDYSSQVEDAKAWRMSFAHDAKYVEPRPWN